MLFQVFIEIFLLTGKCSTYLSISSNYLLCVTAYKAILLISIFHKARGRSESTYCGGAVTPTAHQLTCKLQFSTVTGQQTAFPSDNKHRNDTKEIKEPS